MSHPRSRRLSRCGNQLTLFEIDFGFLSATVLLFNSRDFISRVAFHGVNLAETLLNRIHSFLCVVNVHGIHFIAKSSAHIRDVRVYADS
jgi:hypothetical protein